MFENYKPTYIASLLKDYSIEVLKQELQEDLDSIYTQIVTDFIKSFVLYSPIILPVSMLNLEDVMVIIAGMSNSDREELTSHANFVFGFENLLDEPSQDDFYGTEGWQHFLRMD